MPRYYAVAGTAQRVLRRAARDTAFQAQTGVAAVWVSAQLIDPWLTYDGMWVSGCDDAQWPTPIAPLPLLPMGLTPIRRHPGLRGIATGRGEGIAEPLAIACGPLCVQPRRSPRRQRERAQSGAADVRATLARRHRRAATALARSVAAEPDGGPARRVAPPFSPSHERSRGVATLRAQSRCAFRGFAETRLAAQRLEPPVPGFNARERGELTHQALEHVWSESRLD